MLTLTHSYNIMITWPPINNSSHPRTILRTLSTKQLMTYRRIITLQVLGNLIFTGKTSGRHITGQSKRTIRLVGVGGWHDKVLVVIVVFVSMMRMIKQGTNKECIGLAQQPPHKILRSTERHKRPKSVTVTKQKPFYAPQDRWSVFVDKCGGVTILLIKLLHILAFFHSSLSSPYESLH